MKITISVGRCLKRKTMLFWVKEYIKKNFATCKSLCNLQELYTAFKEKNPNVNTGCSGWLKNDWLCFRLQHSSNIVLLVDVIDWAWPDQEDRLQHWEQQMHHALVRILSWHCNSKKISWLGTQQTWRWWEI